MEKRTIFEKIPHGQFFYPGVLSHIRLMKLILPPYGAEIAITDNWKMVSIRPDIECVIIER